MELVYVIGCIVSCFVISIGVAKYVMDDGEESAGAATVLGLGMGIGACWFWPLLVFPGLPIYLIVKGLEK